MNAIPANTSGAAANNYQTLRRVQDFRDKGDLKIDQYFSEKLRGFFRYSQSRFDVFDPGSFGGLAGGNGNGFQKVPLLSFAGERMDNQPEFHSRSASRLFVFTSG